MGLHVPIHEVEGHSPKKKHARGGGGGGGPMEAVIPTPATTLEWRSPMSKTQQLINLLICFLLLFE